MTIREGTPVQSAEEHTGDLGHNAVVWYVDDPYFGSDGSTWTLESVAISNTCTHVVLVPKEALSLLIWLEQEKPRLEQLVREQIGEVNVC